MTYEQFQASKKLVADIGATTDTEQLDGRPGYLYADTLWIETRCPEWAGSPADAYQFLLAIGNQEWLSNDLSELEPRLYDYAVDEGFVQ